MTAVYPAPLPTRLRPTWGRHQDNPESADALQVPLSQPVVGALSCHSSEGCCPGLGAQRASLLGLTHPRGPWPTIEDSYR